MLLAVGWAVFMLCAYPGVLDEVALAQIREVRLGSLSDVGAPLLGMFWCGAEHVIAGPFLLACVQGALVLGGVYGLLRQQLAPRPAAIAAGVILVFPPVLAATMVITRDAMMCGFLLVGAVALVDDGPRTRWLGVVACVLATAMRLEAIAATLPLVVLLVRARPAGIARYAIAAAVWIAISGAGVGLDAALTERNVAGSYVFAPGEAELGTEIPVLVHDLAQFPALKELGIGARPSKLQARVSAVMRGVAEHTPLYRPFMYLALALALLPFCRRDRLTTALLLSGIALGVLVLPGLPSAWPVLVAGVVAVIVTARRMRQPS